MLELRKVTKVFNRRGVNEIHSLAGVDLRLEDGEFVTLIGSNGAGKTTLFNIIAGAYPPSSGRIWIDGRDVTGLPEHRRAALVGRVFQDPLMGTAESMTIAENLTLALLRARSLRLRRGVTRERRALFGELLKPLELGLEDRLDARISLLSGGQRQALTLLMASLTRPSVLLLDEHTAALDPTTAEKILRLTDELVQREHLTTVMITHNLKLALDYGSRTLMMDKGQIVLDFNADEKAGMSVKDLLDRFASVRNERLLEDRLLLGAEGLE
jgi:putative ABC transport system ATP-binding protein